MRGSEEAMLTDILSNKEREIVFLSETNRYMDGGKSQHATFDYRGGFSSAAIGH